MTFEIEYDLEADFDFNAEETAKQLIKKTIEYVSCPYECEVSLTLTDNEHICEINKEFREIASPTDVLSFPLADYEAPADFSLIEASHSDYFNPDTDELILGDIIISIEKVKEQAALYGHSEKREFGFLVVHSMLHLFGYDHMDDLEREEMEKHQRAVLELAGLPRE